MSTYIRSIKKDSFGLRNLASISEFQSAVSGFIYMSGYGGSVLLTPAQARQLGESLIADANAIDKARTPEQVAAAHRAKCSQCRKIYEDNQRKKADLNAKAVKASFSNTGFRSPVPGCSCGWCKETGPILVAPPPLFPVLKPDPKVEAINTLAKQAGMLSRDAEKFVTLTDDLIDAVDELRESK